MEPNKIDLTKIDWNKLEPNDFQTLSNSIAENNRLIKEAQPRKKREIVEIKTVKIHGVYFNLPTNVISRLKEMKSEKSKQKLIDQIMVDYKPVMEI